MSALLQISDTHFGTEQPPVVAALLALTRRVQPVAVVLSGDITQRARRSQFSAARRFVEQLEVPASLVIPGNHDIPLFNVAARMFFPYAGFKRAFGDTLEPRLSCDAFTIIGVNTTRASRHKNGEVSEEQVERVAQDLRAVASSQVRIVVTHQPVHVLRDTEIHNRLRGCEQAVRVWSDAGADIIMGGHIHLPYTALLGEHFAGLRRRCWVVQAGTAVSHRVRANHPNSVNVLLHVPGSSVCCVERWDYDATSGSFRCIAAQQLSLDRDPMVTGAAEG
jgi:3',5'-cyclic AMP phosphodiesterase CpdA